MLSLKGLWGNVFSDNEETYGGYNNMDFSKEIPRYQEKFCLAADLFLACFDTEGNRITELGGETGDVALLKEMITDSEVEALLERVSEGALEDVAIEDSSVPGLRLAALSISGGGYKMLTWFAVGIISDENNRFKTHTTEKRFFDSIDLLREGTIGVIRNRLDYESAKEESIRNLVSKEETTKHLLRSEATTEVVQLLDNDEPIEILLGKVVKVIGGHLAAGSVQVIQTVEGSDTMDVLTEWCNDGVVSFFEMTRNIPSMPFLLSNKPMVISSDSLFSFEAKEELFKRNITAFVSFPLLTQGSKKMYVTFLMIGRSRNWQVDEIKFISDAVKVMQSILTKRIQKNSLAGSYASLEAVLDNVSCAIYVRDPKDGTPLFKNRNFKNNFAAEIADGSIESLLDSGKPDGDRRGSCEISCLNGGTWYDLLSTRITWVDGRKADLYSLYDITDKKLYQRKIEQQAYTDFLTGLYNRMCCERDLARYVDDAKKNNKVGALLYLDLDDFKHINDGLGHQYGDVLLKSISHSLQRVEGIENTCYRMGGDEFVIVIAPDSFDKFDNIITGIKQIFGKPWFLKDADYYCTMSMGVVYFPDDGESVQDLIKKADIAMYEAKKSGKNRVAKFSDGTETASNRRLDMEKNMRDATVGGYKEFEVYYQPIIDISQPGTPCTGAEALIRWNSAELGFISPADFIPLAEYLGLINPIGNHVMEAACNDCRYWNEHGHPEYKVNVNLSVVQLLQTDIGDIVKNTIERTGINPRNLTLEVTESLAINDMDRMKEILSSIKNLGIRIALDDFGTGYSSLNHIREIPFDVIKVDQGFVKDLSDDAYSQSFIKMVAELASTIGVSICVEGIETKEQYKVLEGMKVKLVQGYFFDRPMTKKDFLQKYITE